VAAARAPGLAALGGQAAGGTSSCAAARSGRDRDSHRRGGDDVCARDDDRAVLGVGTAWTAWTSGTAWTAHGTSLTSHVGRAIGTYAEELAACWQGGINTAWLN
jgi:hypothetical protein